MYYNFEKIKERGFSTLEILIAMTIMVMCLSAVISVSFGSQSMLVDSQTNSEAINKAQELLEWEQAQARKDFNLVNPWPQSLPDPDEPDCPSEVITDDIYTKKVCVSQPDLFTKKITARISWKDEHNRDLKVELSALVTNFENAIGGDTCNSILTGNWTIPNIKSFFVGNTNNDASLSVDAYKQKLYVAISDADATNTPTLFVYNITDPLNPILISSVDNDADIKAGISDIRVADKYLYVAKAAGPGSGQLQIFDISGTTPVKVGNDFKVTGAGGTGDHAIGNSIFYKDGYVYLGLTATAFGPEFHIIDVHDSYNPLEVGYWPQTDNLGSTINAVYTKGKYIYLATADTKDLIVLDITDFTSPSKVNDFDISGDSYGKSLSVIGDTIYLGRTFGSDEFYALNASDSLAISEYSHLDTGSGINALIIRDYLAFFVTTGGQLQMIRVDDPTAISFYGTAVDLLPSPRTGSGTAMDCEGNYFYVGSVTSDSEGYLSVIYAP
jgi:hypothetical protein